MYVHIFQFTDGSNALETVTLSKRRQRYTLIYLHWYIFAKHWFSSFCLDQKWNLHACISLTRVTSTCTVSWHFHISACYHHLTDSCITLRIVIAFLMYQHYRQRTKINAYSTEIVILGILISTVTLTHPRYGGSEDYNPVEDNTQWLSLIWCLTCYYLIICHDRLICVCLLATLQSK